MVCACGGNIKIVGSSSQPFYAECDKCHQSYTWKEYRELQADKLIEMVRKEEAPE